VSRHITLLERNDLQLNRLITSSKREHSQAALGLAAACAHAEEVEGVSSYGSDKVWSCLLEGGIVKVLPKLLSLRRKGGFAKDLDPLDKPGKAALHLRFGGG
jgi:nucleolar pre-ribosomal-associated protein 1